MSSGSSFSPQTFLPPSPHDQATIPLRLASMNLPIPNVSSSRIIQNMILYDWLCSLKVLQHVSILSYYQTISHCMYIPHFIYRFISRQAFGLFLLWAIINNTTVNILTQVVVCTYIFISLVYIPSSGMLDHIVTQCLTF